MKEGGPRSHKAATKIMMFSQVKVLLMARACPLVLPTAVYLRPAMAATVS